MYSQEWTSSGISTNEEILHTNAHRKKMFSCCSSTCYWNNFEFQPSVHVMWLRGSIYQEIVLNWISTIPSFSSLSSSPPSLLLSLSGLPQAEHMRCQSKRGTWIWHNNWQNGIGGYERMYFRLNRFCLCFHWNYIFRYRPIWLLCHCDSAIRVCQPTSIVYIVDTYYECVIIWIGYFPKHGHNKTN